MGYGAVFKKMVIGLIVRYEEQLEVMMVVWWEIRIFQDLTI